MYFASGTVSISPLSPAQHIPTLLSIEFGVVQAHFGENRLHGTSVSGRLTSDFETKDPGIERIGIRRYFLHV